MRSSFSDRVLGFQVLGQGRHVLLRFVAFAGLIKLDLFLLNTVAFGEGRLGGGFLVARLVDRGAVGRHVDAQDLA